MAEGCRWMFEPRVVGWAWAAESVVVVVVVVAAADEDDILLLLPGGGGPPTIHLSVMMHPSPIVSGACADIRRARGWMRVKGPILIGWLPST